MIINFSDKLFNKNIKVSQSGCWEWHGWKNNAGYGRVKRRKLFGPIEVLAHRYSWYLTYGKMPDLFLCHKCDNPKCVNPEHLFEGTNKDNSNDKVNKGRAKGAPINNTHNKKINEIDVLLIKKLIREGKNNTEISKTFNITHSMISRIKLGKSWKHIIG